MAHIDFIAAIHKRTDRDYAGERVIGTDKAACARVAKGFGFAYWDGDRPCGYGGYRYDGRWRQVAEDMASHYSLQEGARILDVGCGKGYLLYEFTQVVPGTEIVGIDVSEYALENAKEEVRATLQVGSAVDLPFADDSFDLVLSINVLHNLYIYDLHRALKQIERVSRGHSYIVNDSYRSEEEKVNLMYWQLTCECFYTPQEWEWLFNQGGYTGDYSFICYE